MKFVSIRDVVQEHIRASGQVSSDSNMRTTGAGIADVAGAGWPWSDPCRRPDCRRGPTGPAVILRCFDGNSIVIADDSSEGLQTKGPVVIFGRCARTEQHFGNLVDVRQTSAWSIPPRSGARLDRDVTGQPAIVKIRLRELIPEPAIVESRHWQRLRRPGRYWILSFPNQNRARLSDWRNQNTMWRAWPMYSCVICIRWPRFFFASRRIEAMRLADLKINGTILLHDDMAVELAV